MSARRKTRLAAVALAAFLAIWLAACGEKQEPASPEHPHSFDLALDFYVNPDHAGIYTALDNGYFKRAGLDVHPQVPSDPSAPIKEVAAGRADLAVSYEPEMFYGQQEGLPVIAVAAVVPVPLNGLIVSPKIPVTGLCQIRGHSVGVTGVPSDFAFYDTLLSVMKQAKQLSFDQRYARLQPAISGAFDLAVMTRIAVGPAWTGLPQLLLIPFVPWLIKRFDVRYVGALCITIFAASCFMNTSLSAATSGDQLWIPNIVRSVRQAPVPPLIRSTTTAGRAAGSEDARPAGHDPHGLTVRCAGGSARVCAEHPRALA